MSTVAGAEAGSTNGNLTVARFNYPQKISISHSGDIYVVEGGIMMPKVRKIGSGNVSDVVAACEDGNYPCYPSGGAGSLVEDESGGVWVHARIGAGARNNQLIKISDSSGDWRPSTDGTTAYTSIGSMVIRGNTSYIYHRSGYTIDSFVSKVGANGMILGVVAGLGNPGSSDGIGAAARFDTSCGTLGNAMDSMDISKDGVIYLADVCNNRIRVIR